MGNQKGQPGTSGKAPDGYGTFGETEQSSGTGVGILNRAKDTIPELINGK